MFHMTHVTKEFHQVCPKQFLSLWYCRHKSCTYLVSRLALCPKGPKQASTWATSVSKTISEHMVRLAQTMDLSCTDTNIVSKQKEARFHMTHITYEFHWVSPKWFLSLWYIRRKPCTYLASRLVLSLNGRAFSWASSPWTTIVCIQNDF
jgi:hypothetical protein